jgi:hypothetical protein
MKVSFLTSIVFFLSLVCSAQPDPIPDVGTLTANNINAQVNANGSLFWDFSEGAFQTASDDQLISTLRASGLWVGGIDPGGQLQTSVQLYNEDGRQDFFAGSVAISPVVVVEVNKVWRVTREEILEHLEDVQNNDFSDPVASVFAWPGKANPYFEEYNGFSSPFALFLGGGGFWDADGNGIYDPMEGDYPVLEIRNCDEPVIPSEMLWTSNHDFGVHTESQGNQIGLFMHTLAFLFPARIMNC